MADGSRIAPMSPAAGTSTCANSFRRASRRWAQSNSLSPRRAPLFKMRLTVFFPYDVSTDGRFLINTSSDDAAAQATITVMVNWQARIDKYLPATMDFFVRFVW